jgi:hypothetical protein
MRSQICKGVVLTIILANLSCAQLPPRASSKIEQVALFKNGLAFFNQELTIPSGQKEYQFVPCAAPSHGTFWVSCPEQVKFKSMVASEVNMPRVVPAVSIADLLKANIGKRVRLRTTDNEDVNGIIKSFSPPRTLPRPDPYAMGPANPDYQERYNQYPEQFRLMLIGTEKGDVALSPDNIKKVQFVDASYNTSLKDETRSAELRFDLAQPASADERISVTYLAKGLTWAPSYIFNISESDGNGLLTAKGEIINEACDLDDVTVQFVTGYPNLLCADVVSPLAMKENLAQFLQALQQGQSIRGAGRARAFGMTVNSMAQVQSGDYEPASAPMPTYGSAEAGMTAEDLFFYPVKDVNLKKGQVGYYPLFSASVPYKHIYQWKIPDYINKQNRNYYNNEQDEKQKEQEQVWHCLKMENSMKLPWTTAPAEILSSGMLIGQDMLNFTPAAARSTLKITVAVNVKAQQRELEMDRKHDVAHWNGSSWDLVQIEGKLSVTNFQAKPISLEITKTISGEVKTQNPDFKIEKLARGIDNVNGQSELTWTLELDPGKTAERSYVYEAYVRR